MAATSNESLRVLVLEDEFLIADEIASMVEDAGYRVVGPAASVEEALQALAHGQLDMAIIDANLRGASSQPVAERLRERAIPFCVCTGYRSDVMAKTYGDAPVLQKPISPGALLAALRAMVPTT